MRFLFQADGKFNMLESSTIYFDAAIVIVVHL